MDVEITKWNAFGCSVLGNSHIISNKPNQDSIKIYEPSLFCADEIKVDFTEKIREPKDALLKFLAETLTDDIHNSIKNGTLKIDKDFWAAELNRLISAIGQNNENSKINEMIAAEKSNGYTPSPKISDLRKKIRNKKDSQHFYKLFLIDCFHEYFFNDELNDPGVFIISVSDGHGSERYLFSHFGSRLACSTTERTILKYLKKNVSDDGMRFYTRKYRETNDSDEKGIILNKITVKFCEDLVTLIADNWRKSVCEFIINNKTELEKKIKNPDGGKASGEPKRKIIRLEDTNIDKKIVTEAKAKDEEIKEPPAEKEIDVTMFGATLLTAFIVDNFIFYLQLGDGDIVNVYDERKVESPIPPDKSNFANETSSLCEKSAHNKFKINVFPVEEENLPILIMISTDGYSNSYKDYFKVCGNYYTLLKKIGIEKLKESIETWLEEATTKGSGDDITLGIIYREDVVSKVKVESKPAVPATEIPEKNKESATLSPEQPKQKEIPHSNNMTNQESQPAVTAAEVPEKNKDSVTLSPEQPKQKEISHSNNTTNQESQPAVTAAEVPEKNKDSVTSSPEQPKQKEISHSDNITNQEKTSENILLEKKSEELSKRIATPSKSVKLPPDTERN